MNFKKIEEATESKAAECRMMACSQRDRHTTNAGLRELFNQTCGQFTAETKAMNVRLAEVEDRANARYDETGAAAVRSRASADSARASTEQALALANDSADNALKARSFADRAEDSAKLADNSAEAAEAGANDAEEAKDDGDLLSRIAAQVESIGELQEELTSAKEEFQDTIKERDDARAHNRCMSVVNYDLYRRTNQAEGQLENVRRQYRLVARNQRDTITQRNEHHASEMMKQRLNLASTSTAYNNAIAELEVEKSDHRADILELECAKEDLVKMRRSHAKNLQGWNACARIASLQHEMDQTEAELESVRDALKRANVACAARGRLLGDLHYVLDALPDWLEGHHTSSTWGPVIWARNKLREWNKARTAAGDIRV